MKRHTVSNHRSSLHMGLRLFLSRFSGSITLVLLTLVSTTWMATVRGWTTTFTKTQRPLQRGGFSRRQDRNGLLCEEIPRLHNRPFSKIPSLSADSSIDETTTTNSTAEEAFEEKKEEGSKETLPLSTMLQEVGSMRLSEIKEELKQLNIDFSDCFDKDSMVSKLANARINGKTTGDKNREMDEETNGTGNSRDSDDNNSNTVGEGKTEKPSAMGGEFDRDAALDELNKMRIRELREELGRRRISRAGLFEKEDLVNALLEARAVASVFSATSLLTPGEVTELSEDDVRKEIDHSGPLLLLDVYATWCGPCQMIAPFLKEIADEQGDELRVVKMDSDKNPQLSSELKVQGLPTLALFQGGNEIDRIEGAPTKEQLTAWINSHR